MSKRSARAGQSVAVTSLQPSNAAPVASRKCRAMSSSRPGVTRSDQSPTQKMTRSIASGYAEEWRGPEGALAPRVPVAAR